MPLAQRLPRKSPKLTIFPLFIILLLTPIIPVVASSFESDASYFSQTFLWLAVILLFSKLASLITRLGIPMVLAELMTGVILGNLSLIGINYFVPLQTNVIIHFLAELGVVILLFQIGLESNVKDMIKTGKKSFLVALSGLFISFTAISFFFGPLILPGYEKNAYYILGLAIATTSVGISARVFKDLGKIKSIEAKIALGSAVLDDIFGLVLLSIIQGIIQENAISLTAISLIIFKSTLFFLITIGFGHLLAENISKLFSQIQTGIGMKFTLVISFALLFASLATTLGLAPIVGAFAAGLVLDNVVFKYFKDPHIVTDIKSCIQKESKSIKTRINKVLSPHSHRHIEDIIEPISFFLVPIFFVYSGLQVNLSSLLNFNTIVLALAITGISILTKYVSGLFAGKGIKKSIIGWGMVPRGEVAIIAATLGLTLGVIDDQLFSIIIILVTLTSLITPMVLQRVMSKA